MKKKISLWVGAICLVALAAWAANPSFSSFNTTQFGFPGSAGTISIITSSKQTNMLFYDTAATYPALFTDSATSHGILKGVDHLGATVVDFTDLGCEIAPTLQLDTLTASTLLQSSGGKIVSSIANGTGYLFDNGAGTFSYALDVTVNSLTSTNSITNSSLTASTLLSASATKVLTSIANGAGYLHDDGAGAFSWTTTPNVSWTTNGISAAAAFPVATNGVYSLTNAAGAVTFTTVSGTDATFPTWGTIIVDANGSDRTLTFPANWRTTDGNRTITVTNATIVSVTVFCYAQKYTNVFWRPGY